MLPPVLARFRSAIIEVPAPRPELGRCWLWLRATNSAGYAVVRVGGVLLLAHRLFYTVLRGRIPRGKLLLHQCDRSRCVNPWHVEPGTYSKNLREAWARSRRTRPYLPTISNP